MNHSTCSENINKHSLVSKLAAKRVHSRLARKHSPATNFVLGNTQETELQETMPQETVLQAAEPLPKLVAQEPATGSDEKTIQFEKAKAEPSTLAKITSFIHHHFLFILIGAYLLAFFVPAPGLIIRDISFGNLLLPGGAKINLSPALFMLSFLLFNAGLGLKLEEIKHLAKQPGLTFVGFLANTLVPIAIIFLASGLFGTWHNPDEVQNLLIGLALIFSMPIAGSSTAWSQNANGNLALSLGLVVLSTVLSPILTPLTLHSFSAITNGHYSADLKGLAAQGSNAFMCLTVVIPSILGIVVNRFMSPSYKDKIVPTLKLINYAFLLTLNYSNASTALPTVLPKLDLDFLTLLILSTSILCSFAFTAGWAISKFFKANKADTAALMFGLGMNNNGTGLVLAAAMLADHPQVMLPLIFYTLFQQVIAAFVDRLLFTTKPGCISD